MNLPRALRWLLFALCATHVVALLAATRGSFATNLIGAVVLVVATWLLAHFAYTRGRYDGLAPHRPNAPRCTHAEVNRYARRLAAPRYRH